MGKIREKSTPLTSKEFVQELLTTLHHELRNDITNIQSNSYFLYRKASSQSTAYEEHMTKINRKVDTILRQIDEISDVFRLSNQSFTLQIDTFNCITFINEIVEYIQTLYPKNQLTVALPKKEIISIEGDKNRLEMVIKRLLIYSVEHSSVSGTSMELIVSEKKIEIVVESPSAEEKGHQGVKMKKKEALFQIELRIYEELLKMHNGSLEVQKTPSGERFVITIPLHFLPS